MLFMKQKNRQKKTLLTGLIALCLVLGCLSPVGTVNLRAQEYGEISQEIPDNHTETMPEEDFADDLHNEEDEENQDPETEELIEEKQVNKPVNPSSGIKPAVKPAEKKTQKTVVLEDEADQDVRYTPRTISKGKYATPIWNQHKIWGKHSSASRHGCGICVAAMALRLNGVDATPNTVLKQAKRSVRRCRSLKPREAVKVLKKNHIKTNLVNSRSFSRKQCSMIIKSALNDGKMVMALVTGYPYSNNIHWVLVTGYNSKGKVVVANSSNGNRNFCKRKHRQYHLVTLKQLRKKLVRHNRNYSAFIIVG